MRKLLNISAILLFMVSTSVFAHHPAADMVDEDVYTMIDSMVADTPHADMTFDQQLGRKRPSMIKQRLI